MNEKEKTGIRLGLDFGTKDRVWSIILAVLAGILCWQAECPIWAAVLFWFGFNLIISVKVQVTGKAKPPVMIGQMVLGSVFTVWSVQRLLLNNDFFYKTKYFKLTLNVLVVLCIYLLVEMLVNNSAVTCAISHLVLLAFAFVDYFVYTFRGNELTFADLKSAGTGLSVAGNYQFSLEARCSYIILAAILYVALMGRIQIHTGHRWVSRGIYLAVIAVCVTYIAVATDDVNTETWEQKGSYKNGYLLNFCLEIRDSFVFAPSGYSADVVKGLEDGYTEADSSRSQSDVENPTIIVIMSESFADLKVVGDFNTNIEITPFLDSLTENTLRGHALSSVYSAKTPNSEWEFLTGNSMAFLPQGSVVYQQYISEEPNSLVSTLKNNGYTCVAMHPYYETGWSRNTIYPTMGFDEMYFIDHFDQTKLLRKYITDEEFYSKIIDRYESSPDNEQLFILGISMQNHGGYGEEYENMTNSVYKTGTSYTDANQYLSLLHESDQALEELITYFENVDDPVEIVFFGDHLPGLNSRFYTMLNGKGLSGLDLDELEDLYTVPFFIWTNYDTEETELEQTTSLNYLSTLALERANIDLPAYNQFLADMMEEIPAINSQGYYSKEEGGYQYLEEAEGEEAQWIRNYNMLEYNNMFDDKNKDSLFFPYLKSAQ